MSAYNNMNASFAGMKADGNGFSRVTSYPAYEEIEFGAPVFGYRGTEDTDAVSKIYKDTSKLVFDADFVASNSIVITLDGTALDPVVFDTDHDTTIAAVVAAIAAAGYDAKLDASDTDSRTIYIKKNYTDITVAEAVTGGTSQPNGTITYESQMVFKGVALHTHKYTAETGDGDYQQYDTVSVLEYGIIWVLTSGAVTSDVSAYVEDSGTDKNKFTETATEADVNCVFRSTRSDAGLAEVEVKGIQEIETEFEF